MWRKVEQRLALVPTDSPEAQVLIGEASRLRAEYKRLTDLATEYGRPVPPPMTKG
jgi:hypothetical protein